MTNDNTKHTPGPWTPFTKPSGSENHKGFYVVSPDDWPLCDVMPVDQEGIEGGANAHLIAAAPELLEALRELAEPVRRMVLRLDSEPGNQIAVRLWMDRLAVADAAIAKAEGRS